MRNIFSKSTLAASIALFLTACGGSGSSTPTPQPGSSNQAPVAIAGEAQTVAEQSPVTLSGSGTDSDGTIAAYKWTQTSGTAVTLNSAEAAIADFIAPTLTSQEILVFSLTVTDNDGADNSSQVAITVTPVNELPTVSAGEGQTVAEQSQVTLSGSASDSDGSVASFNWAQTSGTPVTLNNPETANPDFMAPTLTSQDVLVFSLTATDNEGGESSAQVQITVTPVNAAPSVDAGQDQIALWGSQVQLNASATDSDGSIASYLWQQTAGDAVALTGADTATVSFTSPQAQQPATDLAFSVTVTDNEGQSTSDTVKVTAVQFKLEASQASDLTAGTTATWRLNGFDSAQHSVKWVSSEDSGIEFSYLSPEEAYFIVPHSNTTKSLTVEAIITKNGETAEFARATDSFTILPSGNIGFSQQTVANDFFGTEHQLAPYMLFADLNQDGQADLILGKGDKVSWFANTGANQFGAENTLFSGSDSLESLSSLDIDGDGRLDIAMTIHATSADTTNSLTWFKNTGNGIFGSSQVIDSNLGLKSRVEFADLDHDNDLDVVIGHQKDGTVQLSLYLQGDNAVFANNTTIDAEVDKIYTRNDLSINVVDIDGDNNMDIITWPYDSGVAARVYSYLGTGDGVTFAKQPEMLNGSLFFGSETIINPQPLDINNDGFVDFAAIKYTAISEFFSFSSHVVLYINDGQGKLVKTNIDALTISVSAGNLAVADMDGDGDKDVVYLLPGYTPQADCATCGPRYISGYLGWLENSGTSAISEPKYLYYPTAEKNLTAADIDADGKTDLALFDFDNHKLVWLKNTAN